MPRRPLLLLALCASPAIAIKCDKCSDRECFETCFYLQKILTTEAKYKCSSCSSATTTTATTTTTTKAGPDGSAADVDRCFMDSGDCASCCGACTITTDLDNRETTETCVCYEASTAPSGPFHGTEKNDCVFVTADYVNQGVYVQNQCLEAADEVLAPPRRGSGYSSRVASVRP